jgi:hypothetical protein
MDWIAIAVAAACCAAGGLLGWLAGTPFKQKNIRTIITVAIAIVAGRVGSEFLTPYVEVDYLFANPSPEIRTMINMAPSHVDELKAALIAAYRKGGTQADFERAGAEWAHKYASAQFIGLLASKNDALAADSFNRYMAAFKTTYQHNRIACYDWFEGTRVPTPDELGFGPADVANLQALMANASLLSRPEDAAAQKTPADPAIQNTVIANVHKNWDASQLDFQAVATPSATLPDDRKSKGCYTGFALMTEIQRLPLPDRLRYLRSMYGTASSSK